MDGDETAEKCIKNDFLVSFVRCCCHEEPFSNTVFFVWFTTNEAICTHACTPVFIKIKEMGKQ